MYYSGLIQHEGKVFSPDGQVQAGTADLLDCGHKRPPVSTNSCAVPWGIVNTERGPAEYCLDCCLALELEAVKRLPIWQGYYNLKERKITDWHGGQVMRITYHNTYRHNFGGRFVSLEAIDKQGQGWYGRASDNWDVITMHRYAKEG
jgi:hypothetical protein